MLDSLDREDRLRLMKFICSFAWADLDVAANERDFVSQMVERLQLDEEERAQVQSWLEVPPPAEEIDPLDVPHAHRQIFLDAARAMILADGRVDDEEVENLALLEQLLA
ncbi:MAG: TerB family tellurite resistance protein [Myxococcales bacterium]|nr:TerB family tellurite resistance protein [Myxococcales bacterium]